MAGCVKCNFRVFDTAFAPNKKSLFGGMLLNKRSCVPQQGKLIHFIRNEFAKNYWQHLYISNTPPIFFSALLYP